MKWRSLFIITGVLFAGLLSGCSGGDQKSTTPVTVTVGGGRTSQKALYKSALLSKATPTVASITFTISGPGMDTVTRVVPITPPQTITEVFSLKNGPSRTFLIEAKDGSNNVVYSGSTSATLDGTPVTLTLPLQTMIFNRLIWSPWGDEATAIARDGNGDLIIVGHTYGDLEGNVNADPTHATTDVFVTKLTSSGARIWTKQFGASGFDICYSVATNTATGDIYLAGSTNGDLNGESLAGLGPINAFVTKLSTTGALLWTRLTGTAGASTFGNAVAVDTVGNAYSTGDTTGSLGAANAGLFDLFLKKYDASGVSLWTRQLGTSTDDFGEAVAVDAAGSNIIIAGSSRGDLDGTGPGVYAGLTDVILARYDQNGALQGTRQIGTADNDDALAITVDPQGSVYIAGSTAGDLVSAVTGTSAAGTYAGLNDLFVVKLDVSLAPLWVRQLGTSGNDVATALAFDPVSGVVVTGRTSGDLQGAGSDGFDDSITVRFDANGSLLWVRQYGTRAVDEGVGVVTDGSGNITVAGNTFGGFTSSATEDLFLLLYSSGGVKQ
jgi:hypothetical protein